VHKMKSRIILQLILYITGVCLTLSSPNCQGERDDIRETYKWLKGLDAVDLQEIPRPGDLLSLRSLNLSDRDIGDEDLVKLRVLQSLKYLYLSGCPVTDDGMRHIATLSSLKWLYLGQTKITSRGLRYLKGLRNLEVLGLNDNAMDDRTPGYLLGLNRIEKLYLSGTRITDRGLSQLAKLGSLRKLYLSRKVTEAGLRVQREAKGSYQYREESPGLSQKAIDSLRKAMPHCEIIY